MRSAATAMMRAALIFPAVISRAMTLLLQPPGWRQRDNPGATPSDFSDPRPAK
jgi:hypothetical protein